MKFATTSQILGKAITLIASQIEIDPYEIFRADANTVFCNLPQLMTGTDRQFFLGQ